MLQVRLASVMAVLASRSGVFSVCANPTEGKDGVRDAVVLAMTEAQGRK